MKEDDHPATYCSILIFPAYAHLASLLLLLQLILLHRRVGTLQWSLPFAVPHVQSLTTGLCLGTQQLTYILRFSTKSGLCYNSKIRPFLRVSKVLLGRFFFLTIDGFLQICSCQNSQFQLLCTSF
jgi:hypothetical protein